MHPVDAIYIALAGRPATVQDMLEALPADVLKPAQCTRHSAEVRERFAAVEQLVIERQHSGASELDGARHGWSISWSADFWLLYGHLYPSLENRGEVDETSPLLAVHRSTREVIYGPELAHAARRVLADSLVSDALFSARAGT